MNELLSTLLPTVATALGGPLAGAAIAWFAKATGTSANSVTDMIDTIKGMTPEQRTAIAAQENDFKIAIAKLGYESDHDILEANARALESVNKTMQAEAASEKWPTYSWRPFIGFMFGFYILSMWLLPLFHLTPVVLNPDLTMAIGAILGVASFFRGKMQADAAK